MNTTITAQPYTDAIMNEYNRLAFMNEIPSMGRYAADWKLLAMKADAHNRPALAAMCDARAEHYKQYDEGEYIKLVEGPLAELIMTAPAGAERR